MKRNTPLRRVSKKRQNALTIYPKLKKEYISEHNTCEVRGCSHPAVDIHHRLSLGRGGGFLEPSNFMAICRLHHIQIHNNPRWAEAEHYLLK
jgi:hypothetical protein